MCTIAQKLHFSNYFHEIIQGGHLNSRITVCQHLVHIESAQLTKVSRFTKTKFLKVKMLTISRVVIID